MGIFIWQEYILQKLTMAMLLWRASELAARPRNLLLRVGLLGVTVSLGNFCRKYLFFIVHSNYAATSNRVPVYTMHARFVCARSCTPGAAAPAQLRSANYPTLAAVHCMLKQCAAASGVVTAAHNRASCLARRAQPRMISGS